MIRPRVPTPRSIHGRLLLTWSVILGVVTGFVGTHPVAESDPFWHLSLGRAVLASGARSFPEPVAIDAGTAFAPEWLWDVACYAVYERLGLDAVGLVGTLASFAAGVAVVFAASRERARGPAAALLCSGLAGAAVLARARLRPEIAGLALAALVLACAIEWRQADGRGRWRAGAGLLVAELAWVQVHGSFVVAPILVALQAMDYTRWTDHSRRQGDLALALGSLALLATGAYGLGFPAYVLAHAGGYAASHVGDLQELTWSVFNPAESVFGFAWGLMLLLGAFGLAQPGQRRTADIALALAGMALAVNAVRFVSLGAILAIPLALRGADALLGRGPTARVGAIAASLLLLGSAVRVSSERRGPLGTLGIAVGRNPVGGAQVLADGADRVVLTEFGTGAAVGFFGASHVRVTLDSRVPLAFGDAQLAEGMATMSTRTALARGIKAFGAHAAVVDRGSAACTAFPRPGEPEPAFPRGWVPVLVEPGFTTWVDEPGAVAVRGLEPCGPAYLPADLCADGGKLAIADLRRASAWEPPQFVAWVGAEIALRCGGDADLALRTVPNDRDSGVLRADVRRTRAKALLAKGGTAAALALLEPGVRAGSLADLAALGDTPFSKMDPVAAAGLLGAAVGALGGAAPADLHADLAWLCTRTGDATCVSTNAYVAAAQGSQRAATALGWLADHAPTQGERQRAATWAQPGDEAIQVTELAGLLDAWARDASAAHGASLLDTPAVSVAVRALAGEGKWPLRALGAGEEAILVLRGAPTAFQSWGSGTTQGQAAHTLQPGDLLYTPPFTAQEWRNPGPGLAATLVIASPAAPAVTYVDAGDRRLSKGSPGTRLALGDPDAPVPGLRGSVSRYQSSAPVEIAAAPGEPTLVVNWSGAARLLTPVGDRDLPPMATCLLAAGLPARLVPNGPEPSVGLVVRATAR